MTSLRGDALCRFRPWFAQPLGLVLLVSPFSLHGPPAGSRVDRLVCRLANKRFVAREGIPRVLNVFEEPALQALRGSPTWSEDGQVRRNGGSCVVVEHTERALWKKETIYGRTLTIRAVALVHISSEEDYFDEEEASFTLKAQGAQLVRDERVAAHPVVFVKLAPGTSDPVSFLALKRLRQLRSLDLTFTRAGDKEIEWLRGIRRLNELRLPHTKVTDLGLGHLRQLTELRTLSLGSTRISDRGLVHLKNLTQLRTLLLGDAFITDEGLKHIAILSELRELSLAGMRITDNGLAQLRGLHKLQEVYLQGTDVTDSGLSHFKGMKYIKVLDLRHTAITDLGLITIANMDNLETLSLSSTFITSLGIVRLSKALPRLHVCIEEGR